MTQEHVNDIKCINVLMAIYMIFSVSYHLKLVLDENKEIAIVIVISLLNVNTFSIIIIISSLLI